MSEPWPGERARNGGVDRVPLPEPAPGGEQIGALWLCGKHFVGPDPEAALERVGADVLVCLNEAAELRDRYPGYVEWLRAHQPDRAVWFPIPDLHAPPPEEAASLVADLHGRLCHGQSLLVHCGAGIGRAGTVAAALLVTMGLSLEDALTTVADHRPLAGPESGAQTELLATLASSLPNG